jgi:NAD+ synthase
MSAPNGRVLSKPFDRDALTLDAEAEVERIVTELRRTVHEKLHRQGAVVGISGGIDSSTVLALCVRAFGPEHVIGILLPEQHSSPDSAMLAHMLAEHFGVQTQTEDITAALQGLGCYTRLNEAFTRVFPEFAPGWKAKIVLPGNLLKQDTLNVFSLTVTSPDGQEMTKRLPVQEYSQIVAASNFKQRTRMAMLYYHGELHNYAVIGTANKNEHALGFFVKYGDGGVDVSPIIHLLKSQVYQLAHHLGVPDEIQKRTPTSDTYSGGSTQEEFFFRLPFSILDLVWYGFEHGASNQAIADALSLTTEQVERIVDDITRKQRTTAYLRAAPLSFEETR